MPFDADGVQLDFEKSVYLKMLMAVLLTSSGSVVLIMAVGSLSGWSLNATLLMSQANVSLLDVATVYGGTLFAGFGGFTGIVLMHLRTPTLSLVLRELDQLQLKLDSTEIIQRVKKRIWRLMAASYVFWLAVIAFGLAANYYFYEKMVSDLLDQEHRSKDKNKVLYM